MVTELLAKANMLSGLQQHRGAAVLGALVADATARLSLSRL